MGLIRLIKSKYSSKSPYLKEIIRAYITRNEGTDKKSYPNVINLLANDICNSKCTMCNIWEQKLDFEITPIELTELLKDPLFGEVTGVGITGGEPTMRDDLPELYKACCESLPKLGGMSIITNAIKDEHVIEQIEKVNEVLSGYGKDFSVMVSLDGYGDVHDKHRGREGNFESALKVINHIRHNTNIPLAIGCTITKSNVYEVDALLDWMIEEKLYGRFRVGEFITRLYNNELLDEIRNFNEDETYHLSCFFHRLRYDYETSPMFKRTYDSIISVLNGGSRTIGCPYHEDGVVLDSKGQLLYCAPKSKELGSTLKVSARSIYDQNLDERSRIKSENCDTCVHDYHAPPTIEEYRPIINRWKWNALLSLKISKYTVPFFKRGKIADSVSNEKSVLIVGWYGTETVGDKAILASIIEDYKAIDKKTNIIIASLNPFITVRTMKELDMKAKVIAFYSREFVTYASNVDEVVMGGGPLMEMDALNIPLNAFLLAKKNGKKTIVYGCGIGPIFNQKYEKVVKKILSLADVIKLRDSKSVSLANKLVPNKSVSLNGDPAYNYVINQSTHFKAEKKDKILACFLRDWSYEYARDLSQEEFEKQKKDFETNLANGIKKVCQKRGLKPKFYSMHTFHIGGDDRVFYRRFLSEHFQGIEYDFEKRPSTVDMVLEGMVSSEVNLCMRFHSVLFAQTLETEFYAIDYTGGGKIKALLDDHNNLDLMYSLQDVAKDQSFCFK
ncbi:Radical SAM superfamily enzyme, MoaA/NifB/PqqE/SkfB family [Reichenbachiella agariperforans]|uniref:Radical SAM superfamily enzyme, MoaA/NifB/PqqE/SkfB family n=1 Tax=Reichenbachiella agariperforans TaxID=156994 RepID=A0A1M6NUM2_REIAG|nr:polysaccharide pyruvyl transferase family protein [Reichenbachiella agariperforans]SHJ99400.1 Radical SAM superfamily enzyme, MoaA/NifB/PqqE/SkfB family [Reichenbachiella agariperforans]